MSLQAEKSPRRVENLPCTTCNSLLTCCAGVARGYVRIRKGANPHCACARLAQIADTISELKLGNGTSVLITANIASALPTSVGAALQQAADKDASALPIYALAFFLTTLGVVYVQEVRLLAESTILGISAWLRLHSYAGAVAWKQTKFVRRDSCY